MFTPRPAQRQGPGHISFYQQVSPTPQQSLMLSSASGSDIEEEMRTGLARLNLAPHSSSGSQAESHSKQGKTKVKVATGKKAEDVWNFFKQTSQDRTCLLCQ